MTDPALKGVLAELAAREPLFHRRELGTSFADFERQTAPDFWEVGALGRQYSRELVWDTLEERYAKDPHDEAETEGWEADDFRCREAGPGTYLLTYRLAQGYRVTRRLTVWQRTATGWRALYHQGTVVSD